MKIKSLKIQKGLFHWFFNLDSTVSIIHSKLNSTGKTSLLRFMLHTLGFSIPNTKGLKMEEYSCILNIEVNSRKKIEITRSQNYCSLKIDNTIKYFSLPADKDILLSEVFCTENINITNNILGAMYVDQEKGWTLLNRGVVIGSNHFNIHNYVQGIGKIDCNGLYETLGYLEHQLDKYRSMFNIAMYQQQIQDITQIRTFDSINDEINRKIITLQLKKKPLVLEIEELKKVLNKNKNFKNYISQMKLAVKDSKGETVPVNEKTIIGYSDNIEYISAKINILKTQITKLDNRIKYLVEEKRESTPLIPVASMIEKFDTDISKVNIDYNAVKNMISVVNEEKQKISNEINLKTKSKTVIIDTLNEIIRKYADELGVDNNFLSNKKDYIFTSDLKSLSGAVFHKIVFSFKLAYIYCLKHFANINIPIILDSPRGKEVDEKNILNMINILKRDFNDHQIIIASIYEYDFKKCQKIELQNCLLDMSSEYFMGT